MTDAGDDIFLSYKAEDRDRLAPLVAALEEAGLSVWWDARLSGGEEWRLEIERRLDAARLVIVAWSRGSIGPTGQFVRDEATRALRRGTYLPIRIDPVDPPLGFGEVQALSLEGWRGNRADPRLNALFGAVAARLGEAAPAIRPGKGPLLGRRTLLVAGGAAAAAVGGMGILLWPEQPSRQRIAVLPFLNLSGDPAQDYFSEGITEELRSALSRIGLEVIGRASSAAVKDLDSKVAARRLGVAHILTGSVRRSAAVVRISAQLVEGRSGVERWGRQYDRAPGDSIAIQTDIATNVAQALSVTLGNAGRTALLLGGTRDSLAQDLVLRARSAAVIADSPERFAQALQMAEAALARDPDYADAHVQRALILIGTAENFPGDRKAVDRQLALAEAAARRASAIAPALGTPHIALARIAHNRLDVASLRRQTQRALALSPDNPEVLLEAAATLATLGDAAEGLRLAQRIVALDRLNARAYARLALVLFLQRRYREAIAAIDQANAIAPGNAARNALAGDSLMLLGDVSGARARYAMMPEEDYLRLVGEGIAAARMGRKAEATQAGRRLIAAHGEAVHYQLAMIAAQSGERDRAFAELDKALALRDPGLVGITTDPFIDPLRGDPRYAALLRRIGFA